MKKIQILLGIFFGMQFCLINLWAMNNNGPNRGQYIPPGVFLDSGNLDKSHNNRYDPECEEDYEILLNDGSGYNLSIKNENWQETIIYFLEKIRNINSNEDDIEIGYWLKKSDFIKIDSIGRWQAFLSYIEEGKAERKIYIKIGEPHKNLYVGLDEQYSKEDIQVNVQLSYDNDECGSVSMNSGTWKEVIKAYASERLNFSDCKNPVCINFPAFEHEIRPSCWKIQPRFWYKPLNTLIDIDSRRGWEAFIYNVQVGNADNTIFVKVIEP